MVTVHRSNIVEDIMSAYVDQDIVKRFITIQFKDECGLAFDAIKQEAYSLFWENAIPRYFEGTCTFVPRICPGIEENVYTILGRILWHGYILSGVAGKESINDEDFLDGFLEYVSSYERVKLSHILMEEKLSQESKNFLLDFMSEYAVSKMPTTENKKSVLISVEKTELSSKPRMAVDALKEGFLCGISDGTFFTKKSVYNLYNDLSVTTDKVLSLLTIDDPLTMTKADCLYLLQKVPSESYRERTSVFLTVCHRKCNVLGQPYQGHISFTHGQLASRFVAHLFLGCRSPNVWVRQFQ